VLTVGPFYRENLKNFILALALTSPACSPTERCTWAPIGCHRCASSHYDVQDEGRGDPKLHTRGLPQGGHQRNRRGSRILYGGNEDGPAFYTLDYNLNVLSTGTAAVESGTQLGTRISPVMAPSCGACTTAVSCSRSIPAQAMRFAAVTSPIASGQRSSG